MDNYLLTNKIIFEAKPDAVPYNYRISYKIAQKYRREAYPHGDTVIL